MIYLTLSTGSLFRRMASVLLDLETHEQGSAACLCNSWSAGRLASVKAGLSVSGLPLDSSVLEPILYGSPLLDRLPESLVLC